MTNRVRETLGYVSCNYIHIISPMMSVSLGFFLSLLIYLSLYLYRNIVILKIYIYLFLSLSLRIMYLLPSVLILSTVQGSIRKSFDLWVLLTTTSRSEVRPSKLWVLLSHKVNLRFPSFYGHRIPLLRSYLILRGLIDRGVDLLLIWPSQTDYIDTTLRLQVTVERWRSHYWVII